MAVSSVDSIDKLNNALAAAGSNLVVVDFYATWCGPCKIIAPRVAEMAKEMTDVTFLKVDVDEAEDITEKYEISCMPTFIFFKDGKKVDSFAGASHEELRKKIAALK